MSVLVPVAALGLGTGTVTVIDARTRRPVVLRGVAVTLVGDVAHARGTLLGIEDGMARVLFRDGHSVWVRRHLPAGTGTAA